MNSEASQRIYSGNLVYFSLITTVSQNYPLIMKTILTGFFCTMITFASGQTKVDTTYIKLQAKVYLMKMYVSRQYDSASAMWDKRMFLEMKDFYKKNNQRHLTDTLLYNRVKADAKKYYAKLTNFSIDKHRRRILNIRRN